MPNKYVDFVSDENFEKAVKRVYDAYEECKNEKINKKPLQILLNKRRQTIDEFKTVFDICSNDESIEEWTMNEIQRQNDKKINNKIGEFHQELLGYVEGWIDLGTGDKTEIDLKNEEETIFIELKNKYNTMNSSSKKTCREKLEKIIENKPNATAYWAYVINKNYKSEECVWEYTRKINGEKTKIVDERIRRISGDKLYELITGDKDALEKVFIAIPKAIKNIRNLENECISEEDAEIIDEYLIHVFKK